MRVDLIWIVIGLMAFCMPHLSASSVGVSLAWSGLPYPAELLGVLFVLVVLAFVGVPHAWKEHLSTASLVATVALVLFECGCGVATNNAAENLGLSCAGEILHAVAVGLWSLHASLSDGQGQLSPQAPRMACALFAASGVAWYIATAAVRASCYSWSPLVEIALWIIAGVWALPLLVALWTCDLVPRRYALLAAMPFLGALAGNRIWWLVTLLSESGLWNVPEAWLSVAPVLSCAGLALVWMGDKRGVALSDTSGDKRDTPILSHLPLQRLFAYDTLSDREREVLLQTLEGKSSAQIARESNLAPTTVRTYLMRAYEKLDVSGSRELLLKLRVSVENPSAPDKAGTFRFEENVPFWVPVFALLVGASVAFAFCAAVFGPTAYLIRRVVIGVALVAAAYSLVRRAGSLAPSAPLLTCVFAVLTSICLIPQGIRAQLLIHGVAVLPLAAAMLVVSWLLVRRAISDELAAVASATLTGDDRVLAYLTGRGLKELVAQVALLTARDYPLGGIAATLGLSESTVTHYRKRAYDELEVKDKAGLIELLEREAGL